MNAWDTAERHELRATVRRFVETEVLPYLDDWERAGELPRTLHERAAELSLLGAGFPEEVGGGGGDLLDAVVIAEELHHAGGSGGLFASLFTCGIALPHMVWGGDTDHIARWVRPTLEGEKIGSLAITEPGGGSDVGHLVTTAERDGDTYVVNGAKTFITSGVRADFIVTAVRTGGPGAAGISLLVIEKGTPGFTVTNTLEKMGWHASDTAELSFVDARVPAANLVGPENSGFAQIARAFLSERLTLAVQAYASAQRCLQLTERWCRDRETFGRALITRQAVQNTLTEMARKIDVARVYTRSLAERSVAGEQDALGRGRARPDRRDVIRQEHGHRNRRMGRERSGSAFRRARLHARMRDRAAVPRHADSWYRRRNHGDHAGTGGEPIGVPGMTILHSTLDTFSAEYAAAEEAMRAKLDEVGAEYAKAVAGGGPDKVERHRKRGKLTARERIDLLLDEDSPFLELCPLAAWGSDFQVGASMVIGIGVVEGVECMLVANDPTVRGGTSNPWTVRKCFRVNEIVMRNRLPVLSLVESGGADLPSQKEVFIPGGRMFRDLTQASAAGIPTVALVFGNSTAGGAYIPGMSDHVVMVSEQSKVFLGGPPLVNMATGEEADDESLGGAAMHARTSGLADYFAVDEPDAIRIGRSIVRRLNWRKQGPAPRLEVKGPRYSSEELLGIVPTDLKVPFDPHEVIARIVDDSDFDEFKPLYGASLLTGWAEMHGYPVGILANAQGVLFSEEAQKAAQFIQLANRADTPLLFLHNTTGYMVGAEYEQGGIIKHGAMMINAVSNSTVPHISLLMGASYGAGHYGMCGRAYDPRFLFAWPSAKSAVMGASQLAGVISIVSRAAAEAKGQPFDEEADAATREAVERQIEAESLPMFLSGRLYDDGVIDPRDTRTVLGMCRSAIHNAPISGAEGFGVFRM